LGFLFFIKKIEKISTTKSPESIMGIIIKKYFAKNMNLNPNEIYHLSIMPCYDKKLGKFNSNF
jgi:iron only hydrogenase large subunit-like protein